MRGRKRGTDTMFEHHPSRVCYHGTIIPQEPCVRHME